MNETETIESKVFQCSLCPFYATYDRYDLIYLDDSANNTKKKVETKIEIELNDKVYLLRDPFVPVKEQDPKKIPSLIIGGNCSVCSSPVCTQIDCSIFYTRRFCLRCVSHYRDEFPKEILDEIGVKRLEKFHQEDDER